MSANELTALREELKAKIDNADEQTLAELVDFFDQEDLLANLSPEQEASLKEALKQADNGEVISHDEVIAKYKQWLTK